MSPDMRSHAGMAKQTRGGRLALGASLRPLVRPLVGQSVTFNKTQRETKPPYSIIDIYMIISSSALAKHMKQAYSEHLFVVLLQKLKCFNCSIKCPTSIITFAVGSCTKANGSTHRYVQSDLTVTLPSEHSIHFEQ
jgi:hypothetical protein